MARGLLALLAIVTGVQAGHAAQEQDVQLQLQLQPALEDEKRLKAMLDEWATIAFDVTYSARPEFEPGAPGLVRVRLEGFTIAFNAGWYARYKALHDGLIRAPHGPGALARAAVYARQGDDRLTATLLDAAGKVLHTDGIYGSRAPSHFPPVEQHFFPANLLRPLPESPPSLAQLMPLPPGEVPYVLVPARLVQTVRRIRVGDMAGRRWPVDLRDPLAAPPPPPGGGRTAPGAVPPPGAGPTSPGAVPPPGGAAPTLTPPKLP